MFVFFINIIFSKSYTIDMGSYYTKSAIEGKGKVPEMGINHYSKRLTPSFVAFKSKDGISNDSSDCLNEKEIRSLIPVIGEQAETILRTKPWMGSGYLHNFIDIDETESCNISKKLKVSPPHQTRFKLFNLTTTFLHFYSKMVLGEDFDNTDTTFVIPGDFTTPQINWLTDAAMHARLKNIKTIFDWEATANIFAQRRPDIISRGVTKVLFIDVGATSTKSYTVKFIPTKGVPRYIAYLVSYHIDHDAGGAYITDQLAGHIQRKVAPNEVLSPAEIQRIKEAAEKAKKQLSLLPSVEVSIEDIAGNDVKVNVTVDELNDAAESQIDRIAETVRLEFKSSVPSHVEVIGGSSRVTKVKQDMSEIVKPLKVSTSLNADEALALGGEYFSLTRLVGGQMNVSFYGVSMCEHLFCHDIMRGQNTDLGFQDNPEVFYFNITTPLRRGVETYNWSYSVKKPMRGFTNYFIFKRNPVEFLYGQQCYASSCKNQSVTLITPNYGSFVSFLEEESRNRFNSEFLLNTLEEDYNFINQREDLIEGLSKKDREYVENFRRVLKAYIFGLDQSKEMTERYLAEFELVDGMMKGKSMLVAAVNKLKEALKYSHKVTDVIYPYTKNWISKDTYEIIKEKQERAEKFLDKLNDETTEEEVIKECGILEAWIDSLPPTPKDPVRNIFNRLFYRIGNKIFDFFGKISRNAYDQLDTLYIL